MPVFIDAYTRLIMKYAMQACSFGSRRVSISHNESISELRNLWTDCEASLRCDNWKTHIVRFSLSQCPKWPDSSVHYIVHTQLPTEMNVKTRVRWHHLTTKINSRTPSQPCQLLVVLLFVSCSLYVEVSSSVSYWLSYHLHMQCYIEHSPGR